MTSGPTHPIALCIVCGEAIHTYEPIVNTIHGPYHGPPKPCLEGKEDEE